MESFNVKMKSYFADANIFLRYFLADIPSQFQKAKEFFQQAKDREIVIILCPLVIFEIYFVLKTGYEFSKEQIVDTLGKIISVPYFKIEESEIFNQTLVLFARENINFVDAYLFIKSKDSGAEVLSFDKDFKKLGK